VAVDILTDSEQASRFVASRIPRNPKALVEYIERTEVLMATEQSQLFQTSNHLIELEAVHPLTYRLGRALAFDWMREKLCPTLDDQKPLPLNREITILTPGDNWQTYLDQSIHCIPPTELRSVNLNDLSKQLDDAPQLFGLVLDIQMNLSDNFRQRSFLRGFMDTLTPLQVVS
jgi:hypothetical protein